MIFDLSKLSQDEGKIIKKLITYDKDVVCMSSQNYNIASKTEEEFTISVLAKGNVNIKGHLSFEIDFNCDRCLKSVIMPISVSIDEDVTVEAGDEPCDIDEIIFRELAMAWPMKVLCSDSCKGLCPKCGQNLNEKDCGCDRSSLDPRMAAILDIFKQ